ncbi:hypothetical protein BUALT_Bualt17G0003600 [Buddleja alternifolia]|uniref:SAWADEE domain-containing protein n=1 Tax=Buddleja alternifolia TaxID=168488 RepID=A0AAV6W584_9LAMI|nr:hypothetical protein BUALT_Bualt17G0003600 [Buddleja alternifolia]
MKVAKAEEGDLSSLYDLEYRAKEDDAWYSVYVVLDAAAQTMRVKYMCYPKVYEDVFSAGGLETEAQLAQLVRRFRPVSRQLQDHQCRQLAVGTTVCAAHATADNDLRFYDAVVEAVNRQAHSFPDGEEECLCTFLLSWEHGPGCGTLTFVNIGSICIVEPVFEVDHRISAFAILAKEKITSSKSISILDSHASASKGHQEMETGMVLKSLPWKSEDSEMISNYKQCKSQDEDIGPEPCSIDGLPTAGEHHFILIHNLEKDLTPSSIKKFIYKQTTVLPQAFIFPRVLSDPYARGAIVVDCRKKVQTIYEFLDNPNHLIVSSKGRPWVITGKASEGAFGTAIWNLIPMTPDDTKNKTTEEELEIVHSGTETYKRAKQLRDLFMEFIHHESQVCKKLVQEEKRIWESFQPA